ncbi:MAG TPA: tetratricopeptide repeat protein, partial [Erythrobacter sp.]|nr:tetratricopeptide repeat protein [Erythrobacter sp.]
LDFVATVNAPDGTSRAYDSPLLRDESELIVLDAPSGGRFLIHIASDEYTGAKARLSALITVAEDADLTQLEATRLAATASAANHSGTMDGWNEALAAFEAMLRVVPRSSADRLAARSLFSMATIEYWQMSRWRRAAELAGEAAAIYTVAGLPRLAASANQLRAAALIEETTEIEKAAAGKIAPEALALFEQAERLFHAARDSQLQLSAPYDAALSANYIGMTHYYMGDWNRATPWFQTAAEEHRALDEWSGELQSLGNMAVVDFERGQLLNAIGTLERILEILPADKSQRYRADTLDNLAASQLALGHLEKALENFSAALLIHQAIDDQKGRGRSLAGIGVSYFNIGEQDLALEHLQAALIARRAVNDGRGQVSVLNFLGNIHRQRGEVEKAIEAHTAAMQLATAPIDQARARVNLGQDLVAAQDPGGALGTVAEARQIAEATGNQKLMADSLRVSGEALLDSGQENESLAAFRAASRTYRTLALQAEAAEAMFGAARALRALGQWELALEKA